MAKQDRAIRTRQTILSAAAKVFEKHGYQAATITEILAEAGVTKGALYFHFQSKEELAQGVLGEQDQRLTVSDRACKTQEIVDIIMLHAHRLQTDAMVRAGVRLSLDQQAHDLDRSGPFLNWGEVLTGLLEKAQAQGELLPHILPRETSDVLVGSFAGVQAMSQALSNYQDLALRVCSLLRHLLPNVVLASVLASVDLSPTRGVTVFTELAEELDSEVGVPVG
ncbi:ScbR family autoregulator-binding transcription factor [Streptomyces sp. NPDC007076]|uniref:ScbR family autoregulator-binding transcription factor n=1 Tax=unclassified Streptomyces TaxID=2593676 RepID=UPI002E79B15E|nr:ScbR family autoregulator-binding transcription factor [Streptomyces sp. JV190]MEE1840004.1 ScbR family autoregulator-binding transcription factor [Streptomyces sp. JV190]